MQLAVTSFESVYVWLQAHPDFALQAVVIAWGLLNVVWAQLPKPQSEKWQKVWVWTHHLLQLIVTHASDKGTFTWPSLVRLLMVDAGSPFGEADRPKTDADSSDGDHPGGPPAFAG